MIRSTILSLAAFILAGACSLLSSVSLAEASLPSATTNREPLQYVYAVDQSSVQLAPQSEKRAEQAVLLASQEYWFHASGRSLQKGVAISTSSPGALIRVSPLGGRALEPMTFDVIRSDGKVLSASEAFSLSATAEELQGVGLARANTVRLSQAAGTGVVSLRSQAVSNLQAQYRVHVKEKSSSPTLSMSVNQRAFSPGERLTANIEMFMPSKDKSNKRDSSKGVAQSSLPLDEVQGVLVSPLGNLKTVNVIRQSRAHYVVDLPMTVPNDVVPGKLWDLEIKAVSGEIRRNLRFSFAHFPTTAATNDHHLMLTEEGGLQARFSVAVSEPGRYEVRALLAGVNNDGQSMPIAIGHTAAWMEAPGGELALMFDHSLLKQSGLSPPYQLRGVELIDQSRLSKQSARQSY
ncbi:DUF4785 domain-containing protein [Marinibactrum halimedae]|uniref:DUF4785 family protein n=1 Tax=Marinibactrum halimedae TaxID=1444977 RepID=A0AA37WKQ5_9GAMM|nr:DUF4785 domain-containing protein [Marinibactrum halimedae]MCD9459940.1 DUF4785 family protein [Marinibactrum halimedae]GLS25203.1 hypothetical protein GCM10007877_09170 [Marinibactrum halimedae]